VADQTTGLRFAEGLHGITAVEIRFEPNGRTLQELEEMADSVNLPKQVVACFPQIGCYPREAPGFHPEGLYAVPPGLQPLTFTDPALPCRATTMPSLWDWLRFYRNALGFTRCEKPADSQRGGPQRLKPRSYKPFTHGL
jgi:hypothetical protein